MKNLYNKHYTNYKSKIMNSCLDAMKKNIQKLIKLKLLSNFIIKFINYSSETVQLTQ